MSVKMPPKDKYGRTAEEFKKIGAYVKRSDEAKERIEQIKAEIVTKMQAPTIGETPQKTIENLQKKWSEVTGTIQHVSIPYLRGGTDSSSAPLVFLFQKMVGMGDSFLNTMLDLVQGYVESEAEKVKGLGSSTYVTSWDTVRKVMRFVYTEFFPRALGVAGISWRHEDLTEAEVIAIQQPILNVQQRADITEENLFGTTE